MALAVRASFIGASTTTTTSWAPTVTAATGTIIGDVAVVVFTSRDHTSGNAVATISDNSGDGVAWSNIHVTANRKAYIWAKKIGNTHDTKVVTVSGAIGSCAGVLVYVSGNGALPIDITEETNASGDETHAGFTPTFGGSGQSLVCASVHNIVNDESVTNQSWATTGSATHTRQHQSTGGLDCATAFASRPLGASPSTGNFTWTQTDNSTISLEFAVPVDFVTVTPTTAALVLTTFEPTVTPGTNATATPDTAALVLTTFAPVVTASSGNVTVTPTTATLNLTTFAPTVTATGAFAQGVGGFMIIG